MGKVLRKIKYNAGSAIIEIEVDIISVMKLTNIYQASTACWNHAGHQLLGEKMKEASKKSERRHHLSDYQELTRCCVSLYSSPPPIYLLL